ncbi:MAG TPA: hypothetical protein VGD99_11515 [Anaerolineae bacterium]|jgi:hypothetical protein
MLVVDVLITPVVAVCLVVSAFVGWDVTVGVGRTAVAVLVRTAVGVEVTAVAVLVAAGNGVDIAVAGLAVAVTAGAAVIEASATDSAPSAASLPQPEMKIAARHNPMPTANR